MTVKISYLSCIYIIIATAITSFAAEPTLPELNIPEAPYANLKHNIVLNGKEATSTDLDNKKFLVHLEIYDTETKKTGKCTGFVVARDIVMTAGHCLRSQNKVITVKFGYGGDLGFQSRTVSRLYKWFSPDYKKSSKSSWQDGQLVFDEQEANQFRKSTMLRTSFNEEAPNLDRFMDFAVIKIDNLPDDYQPIRFYSGPTLQFRQDVYIAGFGTNSRVQSELNDRLMIGELSLIGRAVNNNQIYGWQSYSRIDNTTTTCFGDSGGPILVRDRSGELKVLGINIFGYNGCSHGSWSVSPQYVFPVILWMVTSLRQTSWT